MIPNNNLSILPWYSSIEQQNARKWWAYGHIYPLFARGGYLLPFQLIVSQVPNHNVSYIRLHNGNTNAVVNSNIRSYMSGLTFKQFATLGYDVLVFPATTQVLASLADGRYYLSAMIDGLIYYSEIFTVVNDIQSYLKLTWWDIEDFTMDAGTIVYTSPTYKNILYLCTDIGRPDYIFEEEGETRDGYFFPTKQISEKRYRFSFLASEYLLDVMRFVRMADYAEIEYQGQRYSLDTFLITPEWEGNGDIASVQAEFDTATVAKKISVGYVKSERGDFNSDFNSDFNFGVR